MEKKYWLHRSRVAGAMARSSAEAEARLIHYDMAGRYSVKAAACDQAFLFVGNDRDSAGEDAVISRIR
jgi:hypothetical protein